MADTGSRATIIAALIGVLGSIAVALISNWDKIAEAPRQVVTPPGESQPATRSSLAGLPRSTAPAVPDISGTWRDPDDPRVGSRITQEGRAFDMVGWGVLPQGVSYETTAHGTIDGSDVTTTYTARYQNGWVSRGTCSGTLSSNGSRITSRCTDSLLGTFASSGVRQ